MRVVHLWEAMKTLAPLHVPVFNISTAASRRSSQQNSRQWLTCSAPRGTLLALEKVCAAPGRPATCNVEVGLLPGKCM